MAAKLVHNYTANGSSTTDEYGTQLILNRIVSGEVVEGFNVVANGTPNMTVKVNPGSGRIPTGTYPASYGYLISHDTAAGESVTISAAAASPRIDYIVAYVDKSVAGSTSPANVNNTNNVLKFVAVAGTPAASPSVPTTLQIQTAIGASNPYSIYAQIAVGANVTSIVNGNITDKRTMASLSMSLDASVVLKDNSVSASKMKVSSQPFVYAQRSTTASIPDNTKTTIIFDNKVTDALGEYNSSTGEFIASVAANLRIDSSIRLQQTGGSTNALSIEKALAASPSTFTAMYERNTSAVPAYSGIAVSGSVTVAVGDRIRIRFQQISGSAKTLDNSPGYNIYLSIG